jgi:2-phospho-L-lactate/phosphoenolpyruvate guanylyltransferase
VDDGRATGDPTHDAAARWVVVVPVKRLAIAKTRLTRFAGPSRPALALAFAADAVRAAGASEVVDGVVVVTDDETAAPVLAGLGAVVVADVPDAGINPALEHGAAEAARRWPGRGIVALASDLPALRAADLTDLLRALGPGDRAFVADVEGTGTTLLAAAPGVRLAPRFGHRSRAAHVANGASELVGAAASSVRRDVDTEVDLYDAERLGVGPSTAQVLEEVRRAPSA